MIEDYNNHFDELMSIIDEADGVVGERAET